MHQLDAAEDDIGAGLGFEAEHGSDAALDPPVILLDAVVHVFAVADYDRSLVVGCRRQCQPGLHVAFKDSGPVGRRPINGDLGGASMPSQSLRDRRGINDSKIEVDLTTV